MNKSSKITSRDGRETITAKEFDRRFEAGDDISMFMDLAQAKYLGREAASTGLPQAETDAMTRAFALAGG